ncbi:hypothetical protein BB558_004641 [Smittium angustum]|uniref:RNA helicase n=1 Tax=Smittium angustum TaxID=133377 RepID=A0A2U1J2Q1_SMIAN|nr:hypothetical protein BB558_004641 [Smittium angustum]
MGPKKSKKKTTKFPSRGYATVSIPSKNISEQPEENKDESKNSSKDAETTLNQKEIQIENTIDKSETEKIVETGVFPESKKIEDLNELNLKEDIFPINSENPIVFDLIKENSRISESNAAKQLAKENNILDLKPGQLLANVNLLQENVDKTLDLYQKGDSNFKITYRSKKLKTGDQLKNRVRELYTNYLLLKSYNVENDLIKRAIQETGGVGFTNIILWINLYISAKNLSDSFKPALNKNLSEILPTELKKTDLDKNSTDTYPSNPEPSKNKTKNPVSQKNPLGTENNNSKSITEQCDFESVNDYIELTRKWKPTLSEVVDATTGNVYAKSKKRNNSSKSAPTKNSIYDTLDMDDPSVLYGLCSFRLKRLDSLKDYLVKNNSKKRFSDSLVKINKYGSELLKDLNILKDDLLLDSRRAETISKGIYKLYEYRSQKDLDKVIEEDKKYKESLESKLIIDSNQSPEKDIGMGALFDEDLDVNSDTNENKIESDLVIMDFPEKIKGVDRSSQLFKDILNSYSKNFDMKVIKDEAHSGFGFRSIVVVQWVKSKQSEKIREMVSKSEFSHLFNISNIGFNQQSGKVSYETRATWEMPPKHVGRTLPDSEQFITTLASYSISPRPNLWLRLTPSLQELCISWKNKRDADLEIESLKNINFAADLLSETVYSMIDSSNENISKTSMGSSQSDIESGNISENKEFDYESIDNSKENRNVLSQSSKENPTPFKEPVKLNSKIPSLHNSENNQTLDNDYTSTKYNGLNRSAQRRKNWKWVEVENRRNKSDEYKKNIQPITEMLPANIYKKEIEGALISSASNSRVFIVEGDTGCGKSTQIPQIILQNLLQDPNYDGGRIICTQPRRVSAVSIAQRISQELADPGFSGVGGSRSLVGSQVRLDSNVSDANVVVFCTTGVLIQRLTSNPRLDGISVVIVDEVQERSMETDFLLVVLQKLLLERSDLFVVLMSATIDTSSFSKYFYGCPIIKIPGRTFPVDSYYLDKLIGVSNYILEDDSEYAIREYQEFKSKIKVGKTKGLKYETTHYLEYETPKSTNTQFSKLSIQENIESGNDSFQKKAKPIDPLEMISKMNSNKVNLELISHLIRNLALFNDKDNTAEHHQFWNNVPQDGAILVFLPGIKDINRLANMLEDDKDLHFILVIRLHSAIYNSKQSNEKGGKNEKYLDPFSPAPPGMRKVVISTNIAETGITIPDVTVVIDCGRSKQVRFDSRNQLSIMEERYISKASAKQRRGRAGRVQSGACFCLFTEQQLDSWPDFDTPEVTRLPLHNLCLKVKSLYSDMDLFEFFKNMLDPPPTSAVELAIYSLVGSNALKVLEYNNESIQPTSVPTLGMEITSLGQHISKLPVDFHIAKMLLYGVLLRCLDPICTIAAALMQPKSIFTNFQENTTKTSPSLYNFGLSLDYPKYKIVVKEKPSKGLFGGNFELPTLNDLADVRPHGSDFVAIIKAYREWRQFSSQMYTSRKAIVAFARRRMLNLEVLESIEDTKEQYLRLLLDLGLVDPSSNSGSRDSLRKKQPEVYGYRTGHVIYNRDSKENTYSENIAVFTAALITGLDHILMPKLTESKQTNSNITFVSPIPSLTLLGSKIVFSANSKVFGQSNEINPSEIQEPFYFSSSMGYSTINTRIHNSSINSNLFSTTKSTDMFTLPISPNQFYSRGYVLFSQIVRRTNNISHASSTCIVPILFPLMLLPYTISIESPIQNVSLIQNSNLFLKSPMKSVAAILAMKQNLSQLWKMFHSRKSNFVQTSINQELEEKWLGVVANTLTTEFEKLFKI